MRRRQLELLQRAPSTYAPAGMYCDEPSPELAIARVQELLAASYWRLKRLGEAAPLCAAALATRRALLGPTHADTLALVNLEAHLLKDGGSFAEAGVRYRQVLEARSAALGPTHVGTAASMNNLAVNLEKEGKLDEAEALYREALEIRRHGAGAAHRDTIVTMSLLAGVLQQQPARRAEAEALYAEAYEASIRTLGQEHPQTRGVFVKLAELRGEAAPPRV